MGEKPRGTLLSLPPGQGSQVQEVELKSRVVGRLSRELWRGAAWAETRLGLAQVGLAGGEPALSGPWHVELGLKGRGIRC